MIFAARVVHNIYDVIRKRADEVTSEDNFIFGIAESDLQTVGSLYPQEKENAQKTMWEEFAKKRKIDVPLYGSQKFKHYKEDGRLLNNLGVRGYRTSISMSRTIDKNGLAAVVKDLRAAGNKI